MGFCRLTNMFNHNRKSDNAYYTKDRAFYWKCFSTLVYITQRLGRFYRIYRSTELKKHPVNTLENPILRTRDHDYEVVPNG